jgi:PqqD family protein of HPr-rel-A system
MPTYRTQDDVVATEVGGGEAVLLDLSSNQYFALNETGYRLWQLLDEPRTDAALAERLASDWDLAPDDAQEHVHAFLKEMTDNGLVIED